MQFYQRAGGEITRNGITLVEDQHERARVSPSRRAEKAMVYEAADGSVAKDLINKHDLDVILTDLMMPGADGIEVLNILPNVSPSRLSCS